MRFVAAGDSICGAPLAWPRSVPGAVIVAEVGARIADLPAQIEAAPEAPAVVISAGTNDVLRPGGPLDLTPVASVAPLVRAKFGRAVVLPTWVRPGSSGPYNAEFAQRRDAIRQAFDDAELPLLPVRLRRWHWTRDGIHLNPRGRRHVTRAVLAWLDVE